MDIVDPRITPELRAQMDALRAKFKNKKRMIAECKVNITGPLEGTIDSWPAKIQDGIYLALETRSAESGVKYEIKVSYCDRTPEDGWYIHVIATAETTIQ